MRVSAFLTVVTLAITVSVPISSAAEETKVIDREATTAELLIAEAEVFQERGDFESALAVYVQATEVDLSASMAFRGAGFVLLELLGRPEEAIPYLEDAARIDPKASRPVENLGLAHSEVYDAATRELYQLSNNQRAGQVNPNGPVEKRMRELRAKLAESDWRSKALAYFREAVRMEPTEAKYWYNLGTMSKKYRPREPQESIDALLKAVELDPTYYPALRNVALSLRREGRLREAKEMCHRMEKALPGDFAAPSMLGDIAYDEGDYKGAEQYMLKVLELDATSTHAHITLAYVYRALGDPERSTEYLEKTVALDPARESIIRQSFAADPR